MPELPQQTARYIGTERRRGRERRLGAVRREDIRFEPGKDDRRSGRDRRIHGGWDGTLLR